MHSITIHNKFRFSRLFVLLDVVSAFLFPGKPLILEIGVVEQQAAPFSPNLVDDIQESGQRLFTGFITAARQLLERSLSQLFGKALICRISIFELELAVRGASCKKQRDFRLGAANIVRRAMASSNGADSRRGQLPSHFRRVLIGVEADHQMQGTVGQSHHARRAGGP